MSGDAVSENDVLARFLNQARDAAAAPVWCNRVYVKPVGDAGTGALVVFGGGQIFTTVGASPQAAVKITSAQWINRPLALTLAAILVRNFNLTPVELTSTADGIYGAPVGAVKSE